MNPWTIDIWEMVLRLSLAVVFGGVIGFEREKSNHAAGFRTNILVCLGSALIMVLSIYGFADFVHEENVQIDPARLAAQVISGIGFLGAGVILFNGFSITGLTTAATLWVVAAIGLAVGAGAYYSASITTALVLFSLLVLNIIERKWIKSAKFYQIEIAGDEKKDILSNTMKYLEDHKVKVNRFSIRKEERKDQTVEVIINMGIKLPRTKLIRDLTHHIHEIEGVKNIRVE